MPQAPWSTSVTPVALDCRLCGSRLERSFVDLGTSPLCESYVAAEAFYQPEPFYPLHAYVCDRCFLVQVPECVPPAQIFSDYAYLSSYSDTWVRQCGEFAWAVTAELGLGPGSLVIEAGSNDGYLLKQFKALGVPVLGVEPAANVAVLARKKGVETIAKFFGRGLAGELARARRQADLACANNVLAQAPDLHDFVGGLETVLAPGGVVTVEVPHLVRLIEENQFDTIYHEHYSYFSFFSLERLFREHGLVPFRVQPLATHGGSLRVYFRRESDPSHPEEPGVAATRALEEAFGIDRREPYEGFEERVKETKRRLLDFLVAAKREGRRICGYGAPGKGNTLLNYCGIRTDFIDFTVDRNPLKQGRFLPGSRIPVRPPEALREARPDYVLILPWNLKDEIMSQVGFIRDWGGKFVVPIPAVAVCG